MKPDDLSHSFRTIQKEISVPYKGCRLIKDGVYWVVFGVKCTTMEEVDSVIKQANDLLNNSIIKKI